MKIDLSKVTVTFGACSFATPCYIFRHEKTFKIKLCKAYGLVANKTAQQTLS